MAHVSKRRNDGDSAPRDHYAEITAQIIAALEAGTPPWRRPWDVGKTGGPMMPHNATTGAHYRGINTIMLGMSPLAFTSGDPRWATYKQAAERGWQVRKGSRGTPGFFYKKIEVDDRTGSSDDGRKVVPVLRSFTLFNGSQIDGIPPYIAPGVEEAPWREPEAAATIARNSKAVIRVGGDRAFYSPSTDHIQMPPTCAFRSPAAYASVLLHEMSHWSGAKERLDRDLTGKFGSHDYSREELRAELSQVMICAVLGIDDCDFTNGAAYIAEWLSKLRDDKREVFRAASDAQRIADYLLAFHPDYAAHNSGRPPETESEIAEPSLSSPEAAYAEAA
jgi:antirestriction protein ArdC